MAERTETSEGTDEHARAAHDAGGSGPSLVEPVVVGAVVGGLANLIDTDVLFPGWGVLAGAAIGLGCGLAFRGRDAGDDEPDTAVERTEPARPRSSATTTEPVGSDTAAAGPGERGPDAEPGDKGPSGIGGARARAIARSSVAEPGEPATAEAAATPDGGEGAEGAAPEEAAPPGDRAAKVVPKAAIVSARPLAGARPAPGADADDDLLEVSVLGGGTAVTATRRAADGRVRRIALAEPSADGDAGSSTWAELLVDGFTSSADESSTDRVPFGRVLGIARAAWAASHDGEASTSFLGLEVVGVDGGAVWRGVASGGTVLLVLSDGAVATRLPSEASDAADPLASRRDLLRRSNGRLAADDVALLCTAPVAAWAGADTARLRRLADLDADGVDALTSELDAGGPVLVVRVRVR
jgi:hypothetical protein